ncbi:MAG TPA: isoprenylcysteine carboxylmethyltransferase family protein [Elusimicrobiales bacterium]|nr:isoprenylcysteine carboxylmethyltransferase family protein [Elusimicrobiales bacterium]
MKKRILISQIVTLLLLIAARPVSWTLFLAGLVLMALGQGVRLAASAAIVKSQTLTTSGPYASVRNPLYLGTMLMTAGLMTMLSSPSRPLLTAGVWLLAIAAFGWIYYVTIKKEEEFLLGVYGDAFRSYVAAVPCLLPLRGAGGFFDTAAYSRDVFRKNKEWRGISAALALALFVAARIKYGF